MTIPIHTSTDTPTDQGASEVTTTRRVGRRRWPLLLIGGSAGTATWSGWVGLGALTGFGLVHPLPGIWDGLTLNTAITLPVGVEAYAVYALAVATDPRPLTNQARRYAWASAGAALLLGMAGQIAYHLLGANSTHAPWWVVAVVSCLPVAVLGAASLLWHLATDEAGDEADDATSDAVDDEAPADPATTPAATPSPDAPPATRHGPQRVSSAPSRPARPTRPGVNRSADDATLRVLVARARAERPGAGEGSVRALLVQEGLTASAQRIRAALATAGRHPDAGHDPTSREAPPADDDRDDTAA